MRDDWKVSGKNWLGDQIFRFEFGNRVVNWFRSLLLVLIFVKLFNIQKWIYPVIIIVYAIIVWVIGYVCDKRKMYYYFDKAYYKRSNISQKLEAMEKSN